MNAVPPTSPSGPAPSTDRYDVVVVGARVAGAATAMLAARAGLRVLAVDRGRRGSDRLSTLALMRGGVFQLARWGLLDRLAATGPAEIRTATFHYGEREVAFNMPPKYGVEALYAPRRTVLDALLVDAAIESGAEVVHETRVTGLLRQPDGRVCGVVIELPGASRREIRCEHIVGADGFDSRVASWVDAPIERSGDAVGGVVYGFFSGHGRQGYHWHWGPGVAAGVIPTHGGLACVFASAPRDRFLAESKSGLEPFFERLLEENSPALAERIATCRREGPLHGFPGIAGHLRRSHGPGWALVGDAGYFKDPITAHGITDGLRDAELLARALVAGTEAALAGYQKQRDALSIHLFEVTEEVARYDWSFERLQELHVELSRAMNREVEALAALPRFPAASDAA